MKIKIKNKYIWVPCSDSAAFVSVVLTKEGTVIDECCAKLCEPSAAQYTLLIHTSDLIGSECEIGVQCAKAASAIPKETVLTDEQAQEMISWLTFSDTVDDDLFSEDTRPRVHFSVARGWQSDVNAPLYYDGLYHLYYQYVPTSLVPIWENMHWGHAVSKDMIRWQECPPAIRYPSSSSGTAFLNRENGKPCVSVGNYMLESDDGGFTYERRYQNTFDGGDPDVFWYEPTGRYISVALGENDTFQITSSPDLIQWDFESLIHGFHECPQMFSLPIEGTDEIKWVLMSADGSYIIGDFNGHTFTPDEMDPHRADYYVGTRPRSEYLCEIQDKYNSACTNYQYTDPNVRYTVCAFYKMVNMPDDRTVMLGWFLCATRAPLLWEKQYSECVTIPHEITLKHTRYGLRVCRAPAKEFESCYADSETRMGQIGEWVRDDDRAYDVEFHGTKDHTVSVNEFTFSYQPETRAVRISQKGCPDFELPFPIGDDRLDIRVIIDCGVAEIFLGQGERYYPVRMNPDDRGLRISVTGITDDCKTTARRLKRCITAFYEGE